MSAEKQAADRFTVSIDVLAPPAPLDEILRMRCGYLKFRDAAPSKPASPAIFVNSIEHHAHLQQVHTAVGTARDLGLYVLPQATVSGHCYVFAGDDFITDGSTPNRIALQWAADEGYVGAAGSRQESLVELAGPALVIAGPGYNVWGHWLLDFLPRLAIARAVLADSLRHFLIPLPADTPRWAIELMAFFCQVDEKSLLFYERGVEAVLCSHGVVIPTYAHSNYFLHPYFSEFYSPFIREPKENRPRRICVSRRRITNEEQGGPVRFFKQQEYFEQAAIRSGFALVYPEELDLRAQIDLFAGAEAIVGEYGSGMHNALFAPRGTLVGQFVMSNSIQSRIAGLCGHRMVFLLPDVHPRFEEPSPWRMEVGHEAIEEFFAAMDKPVQGGALLRRIRGAEGR